MAVGLKVGAGVTLLGDGEFVDAFFFTIAGNLEPDAWGGRFPITLGPFYQGEVGVDQLEGLRGELAMIRAELAQLPPERVIWNIEDLRVRPPWGDNIAATITDLGNYFVTMGGQDMFTAIDGALEYAIRSRQEALLTSVGPVGPPPRRR